jgi:hypothetical protein
MNPATTPRVGDVRSRALLPVLLAVSALVFAGVLYLTRYKNFYYDEWDFASQYRPSQSTSIWLPHNEHWSTIPILLWKLLFLVFGIRNHLPYEAAAVAVHIACVLLLFTLVRRWSGDLPAFAAAVTLLVLGSGATDIVWAFQVSWTLSVAFGLLAMVLVDGNSRFPARVPLVSIALLCSLMSSGIGLGFLIAVGAELFFDARRRRFLVALVLPVVAYGVWFVLFGAGLPGTPGAPCATCAPAGLGGDFHSQIGLSYVAGVASFVLTGLEASAAGVGGWQGVGVVLLLGFAVLVAFHWYRQRRVQSWQIGLLVGLLAQFALIGLVRARLGAAAASDPHYVYIGAVYLLPLVADAARELPWRHLWRPALVAVFLVGLFGNTVQLRDAATSQIDLMRTEDAELQTAEVFRGAPDMALNRRLDDNIMPQLTAASYFAAVDELGSPVRPATVDSLRQLPPYAVDQAMLTLFGDSLSVTALSNLSIQGLSCRVIDSTAGSTMDLLVEDGQSLMLQSSEGGQASLFLGYEWAPTSQPLHLIQLLAATPEWLHVPDTGKSVVWKVRIQTGAVGMVQLCGAAGLEVYQNSNNLRSADAAAGALDPGWSSVPDAAAAGGRSATAESGTYTSFRNDWIGAPVVPVSGAYDVWYRVRVANAAGAAPEMTLGLWDDTSGKWVGSTVYAANQAGTDYRWLKVTAGVTPVPGHYVVFIASIKDSVGTDWYVDQAVMVPAGSAFPPAG